MPLRLIAGIALGLIVMAVPARAEDKPLIGPQPAWVKPVVVPTDSAKPDDAPFRVLLADLQSDLRPEAQTSFVNFVIRIQTPQGLAAGNVSASWRPETDVLTVHRLLIKRGDQTIDVLQSGQTFTVVRRETNLESATLDGVLTANIQPEGLQVGDILEFAYSTRSSDPTLKGHVEDVTSISGAVPVLRAHRRLQWPDSIALKQRLDDGIGPIKMVKQGGMTVLEGMFDNVQPYAAPNGAPARFQRAPVIELSDFKSWNDMGVLLAPLYQKAAIVPASGPLRTEVDKILAASPDPKVRAQAALNLVQDRVRYVALLLGVGGLVPTNAETTWARRYGDCKAKTALLLAILTEAGIEAVPVVVNSGGADGFDKRLPLISIFNHILIRATIGGRTYWLDGTRSGDTAIDRIVTPNFTWGVPLLAGGSPLVRIVPPPLAEPTLTTTIRIDATAGLTAPAPTTIDTVFAGDTAIGINLSIASLVGDARTRTLRDYWKKEYDFIEPKTTSATFDPKTGEMRLSMTGEAKMDWTGNAYEMDGARVGYKADFSRDPGPARDAPFAVGYPYHTRLVETILLPPGFETVKLPPGLNVDRTLTGIEYHRKVELTPKSVTMERTERSIASEVPYAEAVAAQSALRSLAETRVLIPRPAGYAMSTKELGVTPTTATGLIDQGIGFLTKRDYDAAIKSFSAALAINPNDTYALANRAIAYIEKKNFDAASADLVRGFAADPNNPVILRGRGRLAQSRDDTAGAIAAYEKSLEFDSDSDFARSQLAELYYQAGDYSRAVGEAARVLQRQPAAIDLYVLRANALLLTGKPQGAAGEAKALASVFPDSVPAQLAVGAIYRATGERALAMKAFDRAVELKATPETYLARAAARAPTELDARKADVTAALALKPDNVDALGELADILARQGNLPGAIAALDRVIAAPGNDDLEPLVRRAALRLRLGNTPLADKDLAAAAALATTASKLNQLCWTKAINGAALDSALADCDRALTLAPGNAATLDSKAFVLLRLGRLDDAIAGYNAALAQVPRQAASLYGRGLAWRRKGDIVKSDADIATARATYAPIAEQFASYGMMP